MGFFNTKRRDGKRIRDRGTYFDIFPYICKGRNANCIYYYRDVDVGETVDYIKQKKKEGEYLSFFGVALSALHRTVLKRPDLNNFIIGNRLYRRNEFSVSYVVKKEMTDQGEDVEAKLVFSDTETVRDITAKMNETHKALKTASENADDKAFAILGKIPGFLLSFLAGLVKWLDNRGILPQFLVDLQPFYSTVFVANLGSIGVGAPFHHLYESGTTSIFMTIGKIHEVPTTTKTGEFVKKKVASFAFTIDERISDGYYLARSLDLFEKYMRSPALLEKPED